MVRKKVYIRKKDRINGAGRPESPKEPVNPEISEEFADAQQLAGSGEEEESSGRNGIPEKIENSRQP